MGAAALVVTVVAALLSIAAPAQAAVSFNVKPISWDVIGLDSNNVSVGPNLYEVGARACNTSGTDTASTVRATLVWDGNGINALNSSTALPSTQDEVQTLTLTGGAVGDVLYLEESTYNSPLTMPVGGFANVTAADVKAAILVLPYFAGHSADITVAKAGNVYTVTFFGALGALDVPPITAHAARNEVQSLVITGTGLLTVGDSSGNGTTTINTAGNTTPADVTAAIQSIPFYVGKTTITTTEPTPDTFTITFSGPNLGSQNLNAEFLQNTQHRINIQFAVAVRFQEVDKDKVVAGFPLAVGKVGVGD